ncbi:uncharacterized protein LOC132008713 [Mustela nigripes]|uniref:uncharacterized protein LOC132008713 n=1 Tax=Mustela nigripes TaxID=77151 RepID=UPI0028166D47|nr:uncharacterized protein LOC132008713 [Mustela nigripes]
MASEEDKAAGPPNIGEPAGTREKQETSARTAPPRYLLPPNTAPTRAQLPSTAHSHRPQHSHPSTTSRLRAAPRAPHIPHHNPAPAPRAPLPGPRSRDHLLSTRPHHHPAPPPRTLPQAHRYPAPPSQHHLLELYPPTTIQHGPLGPRSQHNYLAPTPPEPLTQHLHHHRTTTRHRPPSTASRDRLQSPHSAPFPSTPTLHRPPARPWAGRETRSQDTEPGVAWRGANNRPGARRRLGPELPAFLASHSRPGPGVAHPRYPASPELGGETGRLSPCCARHPRDAGPPGPPAPRVARRHQREVPGPAVPRDRRS